MLDVKNLGPSIYLKRGGGGGAMFFFGIKIFFSLCGAAEKNSFSAHRIC